MYSVQVSKTGVLVASWLGLVACIRGYPRADGDAGGGGVAALADARDDGGDQARDASLDPDGGHAADGSIADAASADAATALDAAGGDPDAASDAPDGILTGGPCLSGSPGATAYRVAWSNGGGVAYPDYEVNGLPDTSRDHVAAYGYQIGFTAQYVDTFLAEGGVLLDSSDFIDIELSTAGVSQIATARLAIYGRSFNTTASGSFEWQTFAGLGAAPTNLVSNVAPYQWYSADMTSEIDPGDDGALLRIKAGPSSGSLVVQRIELCMQAS